MIFYLPSHNPRPGETIVQRLRQIDWIGIFLVVSGLALFTLALAFGGNQYAWNSGIVIGFFVACGVLIILFGLSQLPGIMPGQTKERRIFPMHYFLRKDTVLLSIATAAGSCAMFTSIYYIPLFFQFTRGDSAIKAAVRLLPLIVLAVFSTVTSGAALSMTGIYTPWYIVGGSLVIVGCSLLHSITVTTSVSAIYGYLAIIGLGTGCFVNAGFSVAQAINPKSESSAAISFVMQGQLLGLVIGLAIAGSVFLTHVTEDLIALFPGLPPSIVKNAIAGTSAQLLKTLSPELQHEALAIIVRDINRVYILGIVGGALALLCGVFLTHRRLDMKEGAAEVN
jgi:predicted phage tail protein